MSLTVTATHMGGPTILFTYADLRFLSDPTFDEPRAYEGPVTLTKLAGPALAADAVLPVDVVLVSHDQHPDNLDVGGRAAVDATLAGGGTVLSTPAAAERIPGVTELEPWATTHVGTVTVTAVPALHGPEGAEEISGPVTGFVLEADGWPTVYLSGDNASVDLVREIAARFPDIGISVLHAGAADVGRFPGHTVSLRGTDAAAAARLLAASVVIPVHADSWAHFTESTDAVRDAFAAAGLTDRLVVVEPGVPTVVSEGE
jgi:L-ascorbate metabolism protein UlaG (beta-lactamase superfamily)